MLEFKKATLDDIEWYREIAERANREQPRLELECSFGPCYLWGEYYGTKICRFENFILKGYFKSDGRASFTFPYGIGDTERAVRAIEEYAAQNDMPLVWGGLTSRQADFINEMYGGAFKFTPNRDYAEYIYETERLSTLAGRNLHSKRNHLNRFKSLYEYEFEMIDESNKYEALAVAEQWCKNENGDETLEDDSIGSESCAIRRSIENYERLGFKGAIIRIDGKAVAMTMGERISRDAFVTHFEKALDGYEGLYVAINYYFAKSLLGEYKYINREEDMGIEGLRRSKLSYKPAILLEQLVGERYDRLF